MMIGALILMTSLLIENVSGQAYALALRKLSSFRVFHRVCVLDFNFEDLCSNDRNNTGSNGEAEEKEVKGFFIEHVSEGRQGGRSTANDLFRNINLLLHCEGCGGRKRLKVPAPKLPAPRDRRSRYVTAAICDTFVEYSEFVRQL